MEVWFVFSIGHTGGLKAGARAKEGENSVGSPD